VKCFDLLRVQGAAMTQVDASGVWDPGPKGEPGPQGPAGPQGAQGIQGIAGTQGQWRVTCDANETLVSVFCPSGGAPDGAKCGTSPSVGLGPKKP
jgi:hypothetical protein